MFQKRSVFWPMVLDMNLRQSRTRFDQWGRSDDVDGTTLSLGGPWGPGTGQEAAPREGARRLRQPWLWCSAILAIAAVVVLAGSPRVPNVLVASAVIVIAAAVVGLEPRARRGLEPCLGIAVVASVTATSAAGGTTNGGALAWLVVETAFMLVLLARAVRVLPPVRAAIGSLLAIVAVVSSTLRVTLLPRASPDAAQVTGLACSWFVLAAAATAVGLYLRHLDEVREHTVAAARREQRVQLAGEVHDWLAHEVTAIVLEAQATRIGSDSLEMVASLRRIEEAGVRALDSLDRTVRLLAAPSGSRHALPQGDGRADFAGIVERFARTSSARVELLTEEGVGDVPPEVAATAEQVLREALTNVRRHASSAALVRVAVHRCGAELVVTVDDDGDGRRARPRFGRRVSGGTGLPLLTGRVEALGGRLQAGRRERGGWAVRAVIPVRA
ncbi:sensor histidine kinase [Amycolatopsis sacchari]|uniref:sensor histidine kinase n=2 Tax=Amycolatopsis sacchari TaxID=115433 RepID=UPI003D753C2C